MIIEYCKNGHQSEVSLNIKESSISVCSGKTLIEICMSGKDTLRIEIEDLEEITIFKKALSLVTKGN